MNVIRLETIPDRSLEEIDGSGVAMERKVRLADEAIPHTPAAPVIGKPHLLGMPEPRGVVEEHPQRTVMSVPKFVKSIGRLGNAINCRLPRFVRHRCNALGVIDDASARGIIHPIDGLQERTNDIGLRRIPIDRGRQRYPGLVEIGPQRGGWGITDETRYRGHSHLLSFVKALVYVRYYELPRKIKIACIACQA